MRDLMCRTCGNQLAFENSACLRCGADLAYDPDLRGFRSVDPAADAPVVCANRSIAGCNWISWSGSPSGLCRSCSLTRTRPRDDSPAMPAFGRAEAAKRRLIVELTALGLPITDRISSPSGLAFDLLSSAEESVVTGHANGVITLDLAEGDDVHREQLRVAMDEPYRTLLGHFRHEIGHYYFTVLVLYDEQRWARFVELFGNPNEDYQEAIDRHYSEGAPQGWESTHVSSYATMHPAEDWAETFAHYLHIRDTLDTAAAFAMAPSGAVADRHVPGDAAFRRIIALWVPLTWSLNMINRSMGHPDLYPFVLPPAVLEKMSFVHQCVMG
ncbi:zinc-binding metallopeptidase family protein [Serinibacter salmoneus]|uniref:Zinc-ribbon domain-containing protein n=1 Tax=Serinibacter salmoneus TaxID=556530 RepID=A0A2A9D3K4_9MICO|nr:putative zinc-binding metallopeptidase [Serinibacter salmoneus]PFG21298.1 hypothetical protein ATL40_2925 [Serinibacter salmoneus]